MVAPTATALTRRRVTRSNVSQRPALTVVVPVLNGETTIVENVKIIRAAVEPAIDGDVELIVVSDGSVDDTAERLLAARPETGARVIHYDRNLGKGYAVKAGVLAAHGEWVSFIDADLDLDPAYLPLYLEAAKAEQLDIVIGSKRHPDSIVHYPRARRIASWCYQQLNRLLFRLDVRDTQAGIKVFRSDVADRVFPLLLVKQFAMDLEFLAVARALGFNRVREMPVRLDYRFTGSGVRSRAVVRALIDTAAIFYRLRILRTYDRKRRLIRKGDRSLAAAELPVVSIIGADAEAMAHLDYPSLDHVDATDRLEAARRARGSLVAVLSAGARPAGNWIRSTVPFFARPSIAAVVVPLMAPAQGPARERAAAAIAESRLGGGLRRWRFSPGNLRFVPDFPAGGIVVRKHSYIEALEAGVEEERLVAWLSEHEHQVVYTPETVVVARQAPLMAPYLHGVAGHARSRGAALRRKHGRGVDAGTVLAAVQVGVLAAGLSLVILGGGAARSAGIALTVAYVGTIVIAASIAGLRFRSLHVGLLSAVGLVATNAAYVVACGAGLLTGR